MTRVTATASAPATVANQPGYDLGGFAVSVLETIGTPPAWETLRDTVEITMEPAEQDSVSLENVVYEEGAELPDDTGMHTAGRLVLDALALLRKRGMTQHFAVHMVCTKGISCRGTGLGSSGAPPAAALHALESCLAQLGIVAPFTDDDRAALLVHSDFGVPDNCIPAYYGGMRRVLVSGGALFSSQPVTVGEGMGLWVLVTPQNLGIKTQESRMVLHGAHPPSEYEEIVSECFAALAAGDGKRYGALMELAHEWFVGRRRTLYPNDGALYDAIERQADALGAYGCTISGSGPSVVALVKDRETGRKVAEGMRGAFAEAGYDSIARICIIA